VSTAELAPGRLRAAWAALGAPATGRRVPGTLVVALIALIAGTAAAFWSIGTDLHFAYADAQSHLTIARRIFDSKAPGFTQLGTVWLPLPNLLLMPFVAVDWLWATGWAAALLGIVCLVAITSASYRIAARIGLGRPARLVLVALIVTNPSLLYVHTTALTEPVLIAFLTAAVAGLASWALSSRELSAGEMMVFSGAPAAGAVLSRYEGWALVASGTLFVMIVAWRRRRSIKHVVKMAGAFVLWPALGVTWWVAYNFAVYENPLEFMNGPYSAASLQAPVSESGFLAYQGSVGLTLWAYHWAIIGTVGAVTLVVAGLGLIALCARFRLETRALIVWLMATGWAFSLLSLYLGQTHMNNMHTMPTNWWNNRYALVSLTWLAMLCAVWVDTCLRARRARVLGIAAVVATVVALAGQLTWSLADLPGRSAVLAEAESYMQIKRANGTDAGARYLRDHYDGGGILMDESAAGNAVLPQIGIPLREYFNRSTGEFFDEALRDPAGHARWIFYTVAAAPSLSSAAVADQVYATLLEDPSVLAQYETVFSEGDIRILRRLDGS
jgi:4-amino-4-deoxy-L-arabinose transferase-like glycosyltransferase